MFDDGEGVAFGTMRDHWKGVVFLKENMPNSVIALSPSPATHYDNEQEPYNLGIPGG